ncbi:MAG: hypothetical protein LC679_07580 [Intrasporangiaceae bacterium]|nr:hypothetical protein [Intrasporangiaceae bacterium]
MNWNHRVMRKTHDTGEVAYSIREVFYESDGEDAGKIIGWTADAMDPHGETLDELRADLARMLAACDRAVLDEDVLKARAASQEPS